MLKYAAPRLKLAETKQIKDPPKLTFAFYMSPEWRKFRDALIERRGRRCEECGRTQCRIFGDHIVELQDGGAPLDERNVKLLCGSCHTTKTNHESRARAAQNYGATNENGSDRTRPDGDNTDSSMRHGACGVRSEADSSGSRDIEHMLEEALSGRAGKRR